ncbi:hypothetical protein EX895_002845 [Sporisorium graminicola]|uniref:Uncharacterized protein n=1 Tax=Sporisorium graminicola TaxID=280036 RepID=A0A4U7KU31_9BASI|nr:hypothetical protein EX895_002845 [Sporisorium graminicola]TKY88135.1 hypothetical protein EX895_002845 [Sporisorium graminicola]
MNGFYQDESVRKTSKRSDNACGDTLMQSEPSGNLATASVEADPTFQMDSSASVATRHLQGGEPDVWKTLELLETSFPAVASAICNAAQHPDQKLNTRCLNRLDDIASIPIRDLHALLSGSGACAYQSRLESVTVQVQLSVNDLTNRFIAANSTTRIAAALLWALLAFVQNRSEELLRMDTVLACFMQVWQASFPNHSAAVTVHDTASMSFFRAYDWVHLQTAILTGKLHAQVTTMSSFEGIEAIASKVDLATFLSSFHVEQKRLEYIALHLFTSPMGELTDARHEEAVWNLLSSIKDLSDVNGQAYDAFGAQYSGSVAGAQHVLMRHKLGTQLYGMFPRMLFIYCPNNRRHWRWLNNALPLAVTALSCHHAACMQCGWLGDHAVDALMFADLLAAFVWTLQQRQAQNNLREDMHDHIRMGVELGERFAIKWPERSNMILAAVRQLCILRDSSLSTSGVNTSWPTASVATSSHTASSPALRTPQDLEPSQSMLETAYHPHDSCSQHYREQSLQPQEGWNDAATAALQQARFEWPGANQAFDSFNSVGLSATELLVADEQNDGLPVYLASTPTGTDYPIADTRTSAAVRSLATTATPTDLLQAVTATATTNKTLLYIDDRSTDSL